MAESSQDLEHKKRFHDAQNLSNLKERYKAMRDNINCPGIPPKYLALNCIIMADAADSWDLNEEHRLHALDTYKQQHRIAAQANDTAAREFWEFVRKELDELKKEAEEEFHEFRLRRRKAANELKNESEEEFQKLCREWVTMDPVSQNFFLLQCYVRALTHFLIILSLGAYTYVEYFLPSSKYRKLNSASQMRFDKLGSELLQGL
ncbi:hypothetical protein IQ07DRAFT_655261 [Pyrenochaeta sp. DS3sAY3a]|nr:hypothetical protein IQ07DRAFT_655261 [Pyrenochaeta sp. DS3sAY3a]